MGVLFLLCASIGAVAPAAAENSRGGLLSDLPAIVSRLGLDAGQKSRVEALLRGSEPETIRLSGEVAASNARLRAVRTSLHLALREIMTEEQVRDLESGRSVSLSADQQSRGEVVVKDYEPRLAKAQAESAAAEEKEIAQGDGLWSSIAALLDAEQKSKLEDLKAALTEKRLAKIGLARVRELAENREVLGKAYDRVHAAEAARESLIDPWMSAWKAKDLARFEALLSRDFKSSSWSDFSLKRNDHIAKEYRLTASETLDRPQALASIGKWLDRYQTVEGCDLELFGAEEKGDATQLEGRISVRGVGAAEHRKMETSASIRLTVVKENSRDAIKAISLSDARLVVAAKDDLFENATAEYGLADVPTELRSEAIRRGGYALAVNRDRGGTSLYVGSVKNGSLFRRNGNKGRFVDVTKESGLGDDPLVKSAIFADFNNDGKDDLLIDRFQPASRKEVVLYEGLDGGKFRPAKNFDFERISKDAFRWAMPMAVGDFNGDQKLDIYIGFPGKMDFTTMGFEQASLEKTLGAPRNPQGLFLNNGDFDFSDRTSYALYDGASKIASLNYPHSAVAVDLNGDGKTDIIVIDDRTNPSPIFMNKGGGAFAQTAEKIGVNFAHWGMSVAAGDFDNDGSADLYMTNVGLPAQFVESDFSGWLFGERNAEVKSPGNHLYRNKGDGTFEDVTDAAGVRYAGAAAGGAVFFDFDNDGYQDLYVVNGLWSAGPQAKSLDDALILAVQAERLEKGMLASFGRVDLFHSHDAAELDRHRPVIMSILKTLKTEDGKPLYSLGGDQRNRLFHNNGDGTFTDVSYITGVDSIHDGYIAAVADLNGDGNLDLILRNGDPGTDEYRYPAVELFVNRAGQDKKFLELHLSGRESNRDAIGTKVVLEQSGGRKQSRELIANNGAAQDEKLVHFGLNDDETVSLVRVQWPSGRLQTFSDVAAGNYSLIEGAGLRKMESTTAAR